MKALIPAGGAGTRLRPITHTNAKQLVPVANEPILSYVLRDVAAAGIVEVGIVVGDTAQEIRAFAGDGSRWGVRVTYIQQDAPRGLAHTVLIAREFLGEEPFVMYLGDNMLRDGIAEFVRAFSSEPPAAQILVASVPEPQRYGVVELDGERVVRLIEKPSVPPSDLALVGVYLFDARVHDVVRTLKPSARGELEITEAIQALVDRSLPVRVHRVGGWWKDTGRLEDLLEANRLVLDAIEPATDGSIDAATKITGNVVLQRGAHVERSTLRGPLIVGEHTIVRGSVIGPFSSIGPDCIVDDAELTDSVVMEECVIRGARLEGTLLGRGVIVERAPDDARAHRLMVGDHGRVWINDR